MQFVVVLTLFYSVSCVQVHTEDEIKENNFTSPWGLKPQEGDADNKWNWGYVVITERSSNGNEQLQTTTTKAEVVDEENPCTPLNYTKPEFTAPGRRISESKCYEYIWELKHRAEEAAKSSACFKYKLARGGPKPHFAIGGRDTTPGEFPHMGAIGWKATVGSWIFKCGSTLISPKFVLTAAHCSSASSKDTSITDPVPKIVRLGDKNILDANLGNYPFVDANISKIIIHPEYKAPKKYYDIALMELENEVFFTKYVQPACLWTKSDTSYLGTQGTLTGWGVIEAGSIRGHPELQAAVVDIVNSTTCDRLLRSKCNRHWCGIHEDQLCAGKLAGGVDACQGDSGGPLQSKIPLPISSQGSMHYVFGVTSFGIGCALQNLPGIYTRVSSFTTWIENIVWR